METQVTQAKAAIRQREKHPNQMDLVRTYQRALSLFDRATRRWTYVLAGLSILLAGLDLVGLALLAPLLAAVGGGASASTADGFVVALVGGGTRDEIVLRLAILAAAAFVVKGILAVLLLRAEVGVLARGQEHLTARLLHRFVNAGWLRQQGTTPGAFLRTSLLSVQATAQLLTAGISGAADAAVFGAVIVAVAVVNPWLAAATAAYLCGLGLLYVVLVKRPLVRRGREIQVENERMSSSLLDLVGGIREITVRGRSDVFESRVIASFRANLVAGKMVAVTNYGMRFFLEGLLVGGVALLIVVMSLTTSSLDTALVSVGVLLAGGIRLLPALNTVLLSVNTIRTYEPSVDLIDEELRRLAPAPRRAVADSPAATPSHANAAVSFDSVSFRYPSRTDVALDDINLHVQAGESIGVVGVSGAGKSTLVDLVLGLLTPDAGQVRIFGQDPNAMGEERRQFVGYVPQDIHILNDTLKANVLLGTPVDEFDGQRYEAALTIANLHELRDALPDGDQTILGERGTTLSGGQKQRVGLARALYEDPRILVLDEATSALDNVTEHEVSQALSKLRGSTTLIIIAHRLSTVRSCDRIIVMANGRLEATGTFEELDARNATFARLVQLGSLRP
jgi:ABC-type multidrug transport system fused ATPase/permease subunit